MNNVVKVNVQNLHRIGVTKADEVFISKNEFGDEKRVEKFFKTIDKLTSKMDKEYYEHNIVFPKSLYANYVWKDEYGRPIEPDVGDKFICNDNRQIIAEVIANNAKTYFDKLFNSKRELLLYLELLPNVQYVYDPKMVIDIMTSYYCDYTNVYKKLTDMEESKTTERRNDIWLAKVYAKNKLVVGFKFNSGEVSWSDIVFKHKFALASEIYSCFIENCDKADMEILIRAYRKNLKWLNRVYNILLG